MRKNKTIYFMMIIILISLLVMPVKSYGSCDGSSSSGSVRVTKTISQWKLTLANGQELHNYKTTRDIKNNTPVYTRSLKQFNVIFLLDTSPDMEKNDKLEGIKKGIYEFIDLIYGYYGTDQRKINMGVITFDDISYEGEEKEEYNLRYKTKETIKEEIENVKVGENSRDIAQAALMATESLEPWKTRADNDRMFQTIFVFTDGMVGQEDSVYEDANSVFSDAREYQMVAIYAALYGERDSMEAMDIFYRNTGIVFEGLLAETVTSHENENTSFYDATVMFLKDLLFEKDSLAELLINYNQVAYSGMENARNLENSPNQIWIQIDDELVHGATLEVEYLITIVKVGNGRLLSLDIIDEPSNLQYDPNARMLTAPNRTNASYGWVEQRNGTLKVSPREGVTTLRIVLSTVLSVGNIAESYSNRITGNGEVESITTYRTYADTNGQYLLSESTTIRNVSVIIDSATIPIVISLPKGGEALNGKTNMCLAIFLTVGMGMILSASTMWVVERKRKYR